MNQKTFNYVKKTWLLEDMKNVTQGNGTRFYHSPNGIKLPSVTTVTGWEKRQFFAKWRQENPEESARVISRGNTLHQTIEDYLSNKDIIEDLTSNPYILFTQLKKELDKIDNIHELEAPLWSTTIGLAGRVDCIAEYKGKLSIIDFKGSTKAKRASYIGNYFLQATAYTLAWQERTGIQIDNIAILITCDDGSTQVFERDPKAYVKKLYDVIKKYKKDQGVLL